MRAPTDLSLADVMRQRRTIHVFQSEVPPRELILEAIEVARWAPNHRVTEPWRFHLLGPQTATEIVELNARLVAAKSGPEAGAAKRQQWSQVPGWLVATSPHSSDEMLETEDYAATCCAIQNLTLFLWAHGVGVKWTTGQVTRHADFFRLLGISPSERRIVGMLWYGYPAEVPAQSRKPVSEILLELP